MIRLLKNRVFLGILFVLLAIGLWQTNFKPKYRPEYKSGLEQFRRGNYVAARKHLQTAIQMSPDEPEVLEVLGWTELKLQQYESARQLFQHLHEVDKANLQAQFGLACVALKTGRGAIDIAALENLARRHPDDMDITAVFAGAYWEQGDNRHAVALYQQLRANTNYQKESESALRRIYGLEGMDEPIPNTFLPVVQRPSTLQTPFRAADGAMWRSSGEGNWQKYYVAGVDLGPAAPGYYPGDAPTDGRLYTEWLRAIADLNANVVRVYTLLPPSFYRAFREMTGSGRPVLLYQQIWVGDPANKDLFDPQFTEGTKAEIRYVVDAIHGNGNVPKKHARGSGLYSAPVAAQVGAILLGREIEPSTALTTNARNTTRTSYAGQYISINGATATEVWFAAMLDYLVGYETETYNWQHPVAVVNWPPLDPLTHPSESSLREEVGFRNARGEHLAVPTGFEDDNDVVALDEAKFQVMPGFRAGLFASYHVYPYYPDFLSNDTEFRNARDGQGPNPMAGYLRKLRVRLPYPLLVTEYGLPSSIGVSHLTRYGWNHGGHSEIEQSQRLVRLTRSVREAGCAGGIVFEFLDEWYKQNWLTRDFEQPLSRTALWLNALDPEQHYGLAGFRSRKWRLFAGNAASTWEHEPRLADAASNGKGQGWLQAASDEAFLYLRLNQVDPQTTYAVALNTLPGKAGTSRLPFSSERLPNGANFLLVINARQARLLIAEGYDPYVIRPREGARGGTDIVYRNNFTSALDAAGSFEEMLVETNRERFTRDGQAIASQRYSRSILRRAETGAGAQGDSLAEWYADRSSKSLVVRIPWGKLYVTDPSSHTVFFGFDNHAQLLTATSPALEANVYALGHTTVFSSGGLDWSRVRTQDVVRWPTARLPWSNWEQVQPEMYLKPSYFSLQKEFHAQTSSLPAGTRSVGAAGN